MKTFLRWLAGRCEWHDVAVPLKIAELEEAAGVNPNAVAELRGTADLLDSYYDPDLVDCGNYRCRKRRGLL